MIREQYWTRLDSINKYRETSYTYDHLNHPIRKRIVYSDGNTIDQIDKYQMEYLYDENDNWIECKEFQNGSLSNWKRREIVYY